MSGSENSGEASPPPPPAVPSSPDHAEEVLGEELDNVESSSHGHHRHPVAGLGGSAGSLKALQTFFEHTPPDTGITFVVVTHLSPDHESMMAEILGRSTSMPVLQVREARVRAEPNSVYVIPPSKHLRMMDGHLELEEMSRETGRRVAVDLFFRTLADTHGPRGIGIILSGADGDGSIGFKRIKERGGLCIVQEPGEAEQDGMPRAAIATGMADWVLPVKEMPERILAYLGAEARLRLPAEDAAESAGEAETAEEALRGVLTFLRTRTGRDFHYYKRSTVVRRIGRRMQVNGLAGMTEYLSFLRTHPGEAGALLQDLLISVTNFFRDRDAFAALEAQIPALFKDKCSGDQVRVWTAGCATGEEAYSVAMLLAEHAGAMDAPPAFQVFATDLDENALHQARAGIYPEAIAADVSEERLRRFFTREGGPLRIRTELRERVIFSVHDLFRDPPFSRLDLVTCRNLFIYVNREMQQSAFDVFHFALRPEGQLFLGSAESADAVPELFTPVDKRRRLYARSSLPRGGPPPVPEGLVRVPALSPLSQPAPRSGEAAARRQSAAARSPDGAARRNFSGAELHLRLLGGFFPASVVVDADYSLVHLSGDARRWLSFSEGEPTQNLLHLVHPALRPALRTALLRAVREKSREQPAGGETVEVRGLPVPAETGEGEGEVRRVRLRVRAGAQAHDPPGFLLVVFGEEQEEEGGIRAESISGAEIQNRASGGEWMMRQLEEELEQTRRRLRELEEQHAASLEEMKAGHEELQAMNEELRSAGEELVTGREELQSMNEELQTVNQELKSRVEDLSLSNSDLQNLMASTDIATIFLDRELRIKRWTPPAVRLFNFIPGDLGRPLSDLTHRLDYPDIDTDARRVLENLALVEREVCSGGHWFLARFLPYRTEEDRIAGVVLTFVDITARRRAEEALRESGERLRLIFENAREYAIFSTDGDRHVTSWNTGAERILGYTEPEILGHSCEIIFTPEDRENGAPEREAATALEEGRAIDERWHLRKDGSRFWGSGAMMAMRDARGETAGFVKILRDQTAERRALEEIKEARAAAEAAGRAKDHFLALLSHELRTPLNPVLLEAESLLEEPGLPEDLRATLEMIVRNVTLEVRLIDDLLDMTRVTRGKLEIRRGPVDVHEVIHRTIEVCGGELQAKSHRVSLALEAREPRLSGDFMRLQQVFWNLIKNACKFTPPGGDIRITSRNEGENLVVEVSDTGMGMEPETLEHVFEAFSQGGRSVTRRFGGLGLGLAISKACSEAHGGALCAGSGGLGKGAVFTLSLPLSGPVTARGDRETDSL